MFNLNHLKLATTLILLNCVIQKHNFGVSSSPSYGATKAKCASTLSVLPPDPSSGCCGIGSSVGNKIYGGEDTAIDDYPWLALVEYEKDGKTKTPCGAFLISGQYVVTAAHCVVGEVVEKYGKMKSIRFGEYDTSHEGPDCKEVEGGGKDCTDGITSIPVEKFIVHSEYDVNSRQRQNDIALIRLANMAPYTNFIRPICLPKTDMTYRTDPFELIAAGWGALNSTHRTSPIKQHVVLPFVQQEKCLQPYKLFKVNLQRGQICIGGEAGKDSCKGDSGGPLMYQNKNIYEAIGVISFGANPCGLENFPGVGVNVFEYIPWITSNITP
ncbi:phenoloxidase-activating enzyme-like [Anticarsia gemmatalis]|uniref:phenoloxidase-activating enzyme-like n=1 Tax=Anticarsia gemmatalis TaxID=129554 RepID=UPI003F75E18D